MPLPPYDTIPSWFVRMRTAYYARLPGHTLRILRIRAATHFRFTHLQLHLRLTTFSHLPYATPTLPTRRGLRMTHIPLRNHTDTHLFYIYRHTFTHLPPRVLATPTYTAFLLPAFNSFCDVDFSRYACHVLPLTHRRWAITSSLVRFKHYEGVYRTFYVIQYDTVVHRIHCPETEHSTVTHRQQVRLPCAFATRRRGYTVLPVFQNDATFYPVQLPASAHDSARRRPPRFAIECFLWGVAGRIRTLDNTARHRYGALRSATPLRCVPKTRPWGCSGIGRRVCPSLLPTPAHPSPCSHLLSTFSFHSAFTVRVTLLHYLLYLHYHYTTHTRFCRALPRFHAILRR